MKKGIDKESYFISLFDSDHIGDDGAIIDDKLYSKDLFFEGVHFKREWMSLEEIAYKSMVVNLSDVFVKNATPKYALLGVMMPKEFSTNDMEQLYSGFKRAEKEFGFEIVGGDTIADDALAISATFISEVKNSIKRDGLKQGDILGYTGDLGSVKRDLEKLMSGKEIERSSKFITPLLRIEFIKEASKFLTSSMDISDGLSKELSRLSSINGVGFEFSTKLSKDELCSGEEYEVLFSCKEEHIREIEKIADRVSTKVTFFAKAVEGRYNTVCKENHFE